MRNNEQIGQNIRLKYLFTKRIGGAWGQELEGEEGIVCLRAADIETEKITHKISDLTRRVFSQDEISNKGLQKGDLIIEKSGGGENQPVGRIAFFQLNEPALCSNFMELIRPDSKKVIPQFAAFLLYSLWLNRVVIPSIKQTTGIQNLDIADYFDNKIFLPSISIQQQIVSYLQNELYCIDNLIVQKERLINLLSEKRQALITKAVTRGLDPNVKLKSSGIDWLGDVPKHWEVKKIKYLADLKSGNFLSAEEIDENGEYPVYGGNGLRGYTNKATHVGDFVLIGRQGALCGNINYAFEEFWATEHAIVCNPKEQYDILWFGELLRVMNLNQYSIAAAQPGLSVDVIKNLAIPVPLLTEQQLISKHIKNSTENIDKIQNTTIKSIELLKERRTALISAAVTGQIEIPE